MSTAYRNHRHMMNKTRTRGPMVRTVNVHHSAEAEFNNEPLLATVDHRWNWWTMVYATDRASLPKHKNVDTIRALRDGRKHHGANAQRLVDPMAQRLERFNASKWQRAG